MIGPSGPQVGIGSQLALSKQSWHPCALHPARIVGQGSQCAAQHDGTPSVGTHVASGVLGSGVGVARGAAQAGREPHAGFSMHCWQAAA